MQGEKRGLYIHIPFCKYICNYCDFCKKNIFYFNTTKYIEILIQELKLKEDEVKNINTIYIGGGTPSALPINDIKLLLSTINTFINISEIKEFTFEANPDDISSNLVKVLNKYGVNRISLGVQTLNESILNKINRKHSIKDVEDAINIIYPYISNISLDLMFNLPNQCKNDIVTTIEFIKEKNQKINHISYYSLIIEEHTEIYNSKFENMDEETEENIYKYIQNELENLGYNQYEISNYSKKNKESIHNMKYWNYDEYIGIGLSASSFYNNKRMTNTRSMKNYFTSIENYEKKHIIESEEITPNEKRYEQIMLGLRTTKGINTDIVKEFKLNKKYFNINDKYISIKPEYFFLSNSIILDILEQL